MKRNGWLIALCLVPLTLGGCKKDSSNTTTPPTTPAYTTDDFWIDASVADGITYYMHEESDWTKACKILGSDAATDMYCILEMEELDLHVKGVSLKFHVPSDTCDYFVERPYWYWSWEPAIGPSAVTLTLPAGTVNITSPGVGAKATVTYNGSGLVCGADYSAQDGTYPNCCYGKYILTTVDTTAGTSVPSPGDWGATLSSCISGTATDTQPKDKFGFPEGVIRYLNKQTYDGTYAISAPLDKNWISNAYIANYFVGPPFDLASAPQPLQSPIGVPGNPYYEYECLDHARDMRHRIRVFIRSWSTASEFAKKSGGDFTAYGAEGIPFSDQQKFDYNAWPTNTNGDGFGDTYPGAAN